MATFPGLGHLKDYAHFSVVTFQSPSLTLALPSPGSVFTLPLPHQIQNLWEDLDLVPCLTCSTPYCSTHSWWFRRLPGYFSSPFIPSPASFLLCWFLWLENYFKPTSPGSVLTSVGTPGWCLGDLLPCNMICVACDWLTDKLAARWGVCYLVRAFQAFDSVSAQLLSIRHGHSDRARHMDDYYNLTP